MEHDMIMELLVLFVVVILTSGVLLLLVHTGVITVKAQEDVPVLNTEFIPLSREGALVVKDFSFCRSVEGTNCLNPAGYFVPGEEIHFTYTVETSATEGQVMLVQNYRVKDPSGVPFIEARQEDNYYMEKNDAGDTEEISLADYFIIHPGSEEGEYTVELVLENPLLNKKVTVSRTFSLLGDTT